MGWPRNLGTAAAAASIQSRWLILILATILAMAAMVTVGAEDAVKCLKGVKESLQDPQGRLFSWSFSNSSVGFICNFVGVSCWNLQENRVLNLELSSMGLAGGIPSALQLCSSITHLVLSGNSLTGKIPSELCQWLPNLVYLDLSGNRLSGEIPPELADCAYLNTLFLSGNELSGAIPSRLSELSRLRDFSVANNRLSGSIPSVLGSFASSDFEGNSDLCGGPLGRCSGGLSRRSLIIIIAAGLFGAIVSSLVVLAIFRWYVVRPAGGRRRTTAEDAGGAAGWAERLRPHRTVQVSLFQKPIVKVKLGDLMAATGDFSPDHIISFSTGRGGATYRAVLSDGSALAVKRLPFCRLPEKHFRLEVSRLGQLRHPNLVPLLGFCAVLDERLLVYKHMPGGSLSSALHSHPSSAAAAALDWACRVRIAVGAARGLAWLHHGIQPPLLHQSFSSAAVLLDDDMEPRITDFGLAQLGGSSGAGDGGGATSSLVNGDFGDFGYVAPEYHSTMVPSMKGDVYSFGVVLLELATGQRPIEVVVPVDYAEEGSFKGGLVDWVNMLSAAGRLADAIDGPLRGGGHEEEILQLLKVACGCVAARPKERAPMYKVYQSLKAIGRSSRDAFDQFDEFPLVYAREDQEPR
ncbi:unnamed protein product [Spirodela intermedia]|uniref:Protein kinase domain-containing protein n=1 Tax=Spirodela intermedia TaxID=51605 RepID=A0A7I8LEG8_SPIIN|nr:unnamed protein product [Spirodela intermedia]